VRVQPRAARTELAGLIGDEIRVRVAAPPVDGAANEALVRFLAEQLGVARQAVRVLSGLGSRSKTLFVGQLTPEQVLARLGLPGAARPAGPPDRRT